MRKIILLAALIAAVGYVHARSSNKPLDANYGFKYLGAFPNGGYKTYGDGTFIIVDAGSDIAQMATIPTLHISQEKKAGYAIVPAKNIQEAVQNGHFAQGYAVDCIKMVVFDERNREFPASELNILHQNAVQIACKSLQSAEE